MRRTIPLLAAMAVFGAYCSAPFSVPTTLVIINDNYQFVPDTLTIPHGSSVEWKNESQQYHVVQSDSVTPGAMGEFPLAPVGGQTFEYPETQGTQQMFAPGVYPYHCELHPQMHGVLIVR